MIYLKGFRLPDIGTEEGFFTNLKRTCYTNYYPFGVFPSKALNRIDFDPVTIFYGSNGSGKTTLLNVIAETIKAQRSAPFNKSSFFGDYVNRCEAKWEGFYHDSMVITSDDVFDYLFDMRTLNQGIDNKREDLLREYTDLKYSKFQMRSLADFTEDEMDLEILYEKYPLNDFDDAFYACYDEHDLTKILADYGREHILENDR